jgi:hypothetical protein
MHLLAGRIFLKNGIADGGVRWEEPVAWLKRPSSFDHERVISILEGKPDGHFAHRLWLGLASCSLCQSFPVFFSCGSCKVAAGY